MFSHHLTEPKNPERVVLLGANGFIARATLGKLNYAGINCLEITREVVDLAEDNCVERLRDVLRPKDLIIFFAAKAPAKTNDDVVYNLRIASNVCKAVPPDLISGLIYVSSDAVYSDSDQPLTERSITAPSSLHGIMHFGREIMLANIYAEKLLIVRPTLVFGEGDPHNGYGPNRFLRETRGSKTINLFGGGEERRDHVWVEDVADVISLACRFQTRGVLNIATGAVLSFLEIAEMFAKVFDDIQIIKSKRVGDMPHRGFRPFDTTLLKVGFPDISLKSVDDWVSGLSK